VDDKRYSCAHVVPIEQEPRHHLVIEHFFVRAFAVEIAPYDRTLCHNHSQDYLVYVVGNGEILSVPRDGEWKRLNYDDGECESSSAGLVHVVENLRDTPFRNIVIELLPFLIVLPRREGPTLMTGTAVVIERFSNDRTAVFTLEMEAGSAVEVCGPAVVASPYAHTVRLEEFGKAMRTLSDFKDLAEVWPRHQVLVRNTEKTRAKVVVFQVGVKMYRNRAGKLIALPSD
jgi:hypothetical protein